MKRSLLLALTAAIVSALLSAPALAAPTDPPQASPSGTAQPIDWDQYAPGGTLSPEKITASSAILIDAATGKVLFGKAESSKHYPASTTKIMTCLLALEHSQDLSEQVTVGTLPALDDPKAVSFALKKGEKLSLESLLYILMLPSANDAANAVAIHVAGSVSKFVTMMNDRAKELGMTGTHYSNANGLADDEQHYTTAADMAKLAWTAMKNLQFKAIVIKQSYPVPATNMHKAKTVTNTNYLLDPSNGDYFYQYANGIKTGFTSMANNTFVSSAQKGGVSLIAVILDEKEREDMWTDSITLFDYGFKFYSTVNLGELLNGKTLSLPVKGAADEDSGKGSLDAAIKPKGSATVTDRAELLQKLGSDPLALEHKLAISADTAPIRQGDVLGTITYSHDGADVLTCDLVATRDVAVKTAPPPTPSPAPTAMSTVPTQKPVVTVTAEPAEKDTTVFLLAGGAILLAILAVVVLLIWSVKQTGRQRREYNDRQDGTGLR